MRSLSAIFRYRFVIGNRDRFGRYYASCYQILSADLWIPSEILRREITVGKCDMIGTKNLVLFVIKFCGKICKFRREFCKSVGKFRSMNLYNNCSKDMFYLLAIFHSEIAVGKCVMTYLKNFLLCVIEFRRQIHTFYWQFSIGNLV